MKARLLLSGAGKWGMNYRRLLQDHPRAELAGVVKSDREFYKALREQQWSGVILAAPASTLPAQLRATLEMGFPTLVEKPVAQSYAETDSLRSMAMATGTPVLVDFTYLYHPEFLAIRQRLAAREIISIESEGGNLGPFRENCPSLWDYGTHEVAMALTLMGRAKRVHLQSKNQNGGQIHTLRLKSERCEAHLSFGNGFPERRRWMKIRTAQEDFVFSDDGRTHRPLDQVVECFLDGPDENWGLDLAAEISRILEG